MNTMPLKYGQILSAAIVCQAKYSPDGKDIIMFNKELYRDFMPEVRNIVEVHVDVFMFYCILIARPVFGKLKRQLFKLHPRDFHKANIIFSQARFP